MIKIKINSINFLVDSKLTVLEACHFIGIHVPRFCYHEMLSVAGNCRMCLVEIEKSPKPVVSCALPLTNNISIYTDSPLVKKARENILESLLLNHPLDCPICDQGGECDLQDQTKIFGGDYSRYYSNKRIVQSKPFGVFIKTIMTRCIHCTRCVRFSEEVAGTSSFGTLNRGKNTEIGAYTFNNFDSEISGNVVDLCPVGALTLKSYAFKARPWELKYQESIDFTSSLCTPTIINTKESEIVRVQPKISNVLDNMLISNKIRFSYDSIKKNRIQQIFKKSNLNNFSKENWFSFEKLFKELLEKKNKLTFLISENLDLESCQLLKSLENKSIKTLNISNTNFNYKNLNTTSIFNTTDLIKDAKIKTCLLISVNLKIETTLINTKLRQKFYKSSLCVLNNGNYYKSNYPIRFINLSIQNSIKLFEGKLYYSYKFLDQSKTLLILGNTFNKKIYDIQYLINMYIKICQTGLIIQNEIYPNSIGLKFLGVNNLKNNKNKKDEYFICVNLEDNIKIRKFLQKKKFFWFNSFGSDLATKSDYILPITTYYESEILFLNINNIIKKIIKVLPCHKESKNFYDFLCLFFLQHNNYSKKILNYSRNLNNNKILFKLNFYKTFNTYVYKNPIKSVIENFYADSNFTKNSKILAQKIQEQTKQNHTTF